jgi:shikimate kinase
MSATGRAKNAFRRQARAIRFKLGMANSKSHSERWLLRRLRRSGFVVTDHREVTSYNDGSRYVILALRRFQPLNHESIELFGLPGVGKSTLSRAIVKSAKGAITDGFKMMEPWSLWACFSASPIASMVFLARLIPVLPELRSPAAKRIVVAAVRQKIVDSRIRGTILYEEGVTHEIWRQLMSGETLTDALISRVLPVADHIIFLEAQPAHLVERLGSKASPGPVSRLLLQEPIEGEAWDQAIAHYDRIKRIVHSSRGRSTSVPNQGGVDEALRALRQIIDDQDKRSRSL